LGYALVQPAWTALAVFSALGAGLAAPYVLLSSAPALLRWLPRPGAWMESLRRALAFPLYATVVWLVWVLGRQAGVDAAAILLLSLTVAAFGAWLWGRGRATPARGRPAAVAVVAGGAIALALYGASAAAGSSPDDAVGEGWERFSVERVAAFRAERRAVFVDFTASWCLSCQVNERVTLANQDVIRAFADGDVALLKAGWTSRDSEIAAALQSFGRSGVPLYVLYPADPVLPPQMLPAILTPRIVLNAVAAAVAEERPD
jgi:thiol:disulfide interchange protein